MLDVGDTKRLSFLARDVADVPVNPTTVVLTVTLPDATTVQPAVTNPPAQVGAFEVDYVIAQYGRHVVRWVGTDPEVAYVDVFSAADPAWPALVGLAETKHHLNYQADDISDDEELRGFISSASEVVEDIVGVVARRQLVETYSGGDRVILLRRRPVESVTSVVIDGTTVDAGDYTPSPSGILARRSGRWPTGFRNVEVTYTAGRPAGPASVIDATKELIRINWRPQQGGNYSPFDGGRGDDFGSGGLEASLQGEIRLGFFVPNTVMQRLMPHGRGPHVA